MEIPINQIIQSDCLAGLKSVPDNSVDCCITSPPYFGLRDYGTGSWVGGDENCDHRRNTKNANPDWLIQTRGKVDNGVGDEIFKQSCNKCGAERIDAQFGLEETPELFVQNLVNVFSQVKRVLKPTGTLWVNIGDSYAANRSYQVHQSVEGKGYAVDIEKFGGKGSKIPDGLKQKDLIGIPWLLAFALRADGWYLRQDIIWAKPNPMPESVTDRCTKSHEYIFLMSKSAKYFYDNEAIKVQASESFKNDSRHKTGSNKNNIKIGYEESGAQNPKGPHRMFDKSHGTVIGGMANKRSVWTVTTKPFAEAHFATFPEDLIVDCIKAGTSEYGCCGGCGAPWERVTESEKHFMSGSGKSGNPISGKNGDSLQGGGTTGDIRKGPTIETTTIGWEPTCRCNLPAVPCIVLDPFMGAGTTALVARKLNRNYIGLELNPAYIKIAEKRLKKELGIFA